MRRLLVVMLLMTGVVASSLGWAQREKAKEIPTHPRALDYYASITQLSMGSREYSRSPGDPEIGRQYRAAVLTSEIFSTLVIELVTTGEEGCCATVAWSRAVDTEALRGAFNIRGEFAGFIVDSWRSARSFQFSVQGRRFIATVDASPRLMIEEM